MPIRVDIRDNEWRQNRALSLTLFSKIAALELEKAAVSAFRRHLAILEQRSIDLVYAAESKLNELWNVLRKDHPEGVVLEIAMRALWHSFEGDVRFLCDHVMDDEPHNQAAVAHAAGNALIGLRAMIMACLRNDDQPFDPQQMCDYISSIAQVRDMDGLPNQLQMVLGHIAMNKAWGECVSNRE